VLLALGLFVPWLAGCDPPPPGRAQPFGCEIFVRGTFFDEDPDESFEICDDTNRLEYTGKTRYACTITIPPGTHRFKVADASWKAVNLGAWQADFVLQPRTAYGSLAGSDSKDFIIEIPEEGKYRFEVHASNRAKPVIRYSKAR